MPCITKSKTDYRQGCTILNADLTAFPTKKTQSLLDNNTQINDDETYFASMRRASEIISAGKAESDRSRHRNANQRITLGRKLKNHAVRT